LGCRDATSLRSLTATSAADLSTSSNEFNMILIIADDLGRKPGYHIDD
jgi:hypothetical protein